MVRNAYALNACVEEQNRTALSEILAFSGAGDQSAAPLPLPADWVVDWARFFELDEATTPILLGELENLLTVAQLAQAMTMASRKQLLLNLL